MTGSQIRDVVRSWTQQTRFGYMAGGGALAIGLGVHALSTVVHDGPPTAAASALVQTDERAAADLSKPVPDTPPPGGKREWALAFGAESESMDTVVRGRGCRECRGTGFRGRAGIYEMLVLDDELRAELVSGRNTVQLRRHAVERGMRTLRQDGLRQVLAGITTPEEVLRVTRK